MTSHSIVRTTDQQGTSLDNALIPPLPSPEPAALYLRSYLAPTKPMPITHPTGIIALMTVYTSTNTTAVSRSLDG